MGKLKDWWKNRPYWQKGGIVGLFIIISLLIMSINVISSNALCSSNADCSQFKPLYYIICVRPLSLDIKCINNECVLGCYNKHETEYVNLTQPGPEIKPNIIEVEKEEECTESSFECSDWGECQGTLKIGSQSRTCELKTECMGDYKPKELQNCNLPPIQKEEINESNEISNKDNKNSVENIVIIENVGLKEEILLFFKKIWGWFN